MDDILSFISNINSNKFCGIIIEEPQNSINELQEIQNKYESKFEALKFKMVIKGYQCPRYGKCTRFYIVDEGITV